MLLPIIPLLVLGCCKFLFDYYVDFPEPRITRITYTITDQEAWTIEDLREVNEVSAPINWIELD